jgi:spore germination protein KB
MQNNSVSARNIACMIAAYSLCSGLMSGFGTLGQDMWLAVIASAVLNIPLILMFARIAKVNAGLGLIEILDKRFGKVAGAILAAFLAWYALHVSSLVTRNFTEFVATISLDKTPKVFIMIGLIAVAGILAASKVKVIVRWSLVVMILITFNLVLSTLAALPAMHVSFLKPVMEHSLGEIVSTGFSLGAMAFSETVIALVVFGSLKKGDSPFKTYFLGFGWGALLILMVVVRNITVLGRDMVANLTFPSFVAARVVNPGSYIEHIESIVSFNMILLGVTKVSICIRAAAMGIAKVLRMEEQSKQCIIPVCMLSVALCVISFTNIQELLAFVEAYRFYALPFVALIPAIIWIKSEIAKAKSR